MWSVIVTLALLVGCTMPATQARDIANLDQMEEMDTQFTMGGHGRHLAGVLPCTAPLM